ncbi:MAG TPA: O-antigen polymerase [Gammaproteobacteria bacterium]|nr:O-antigen polymerase [Gammaproteobacteria bacterium]
MNTLICAIIISIIGLINYRFSKKIFHPAVIFSGYWAILLLLLVVLPNDYYALSNKTLLIFTTGILCFSYGGFLSRFVINSQSQPNYILSGTNETSSRSWIPSTLLAGLVLCVLLFPYYCYYLYQISLTHQHEFLQYHYLNPLSKFFMTLRQAVVYNKGLGIFKYLIAWFGFLSLVALIEYYSHKTLKNKLIVVGFFITVLLYCLLTTARMAVIYFLFSFFSMYFILVRKLELKKIFISGLFIICAFIIPAIIMHKGVHLNTGISSTSNLLSLIKNIELYLLGGIVAFNETVIYPVLTIPFPHDYSLSFFLKIAHLFNNDIIIPAAIFPYINIPDPTNVYTLFFSWFLDFDWPGIIILFSILGFITTLCFHYATRKNPIALMFYAHIVAGLLLSNFFDAFLVGLSFWLQLFIFTFLIYKVPLVLNSFYKIKVKHASNS